MTGSEFERACAKRLSDNGWWALVIPKDNHGSQPFDLIACKGDMICAYDCKVISSDRTQVFTHERIELNQQTAMRKFTNRVNCFQCGFIVLRSTDFTVDWEKVYFIDYSSIDWQKPSSKLSHIWEV